MLRNKKNVSIIAIVLITIIGLVYAGCSQNIDKVATTPTSKIAIKSINNSNLETFENQRYEIKCEIGPNKIYRIKGKPEEISGILDLCKGDFYRIMINNGDGESKQITAGEIWVDGEEVVSENDFKKKNFTFFRGGRIKNNNPTYFIRLRGKPGTFITVNFYAYGKIYKDYTMYNDKMDEISKLFAELLKENYNTEMTNEEFLMNNFENAEQKYLDFESFLNLLSSNLKVTEIKNDLNALKGEYYIPLFRILYGKYNGDANLQYVIITEYDNKSNSGYGYNAEGLKIEINSDNLHSYNAYRISPYINTVAELNKINRIVDDNFKASYKNNTFLLGPELICFTDFSTGAEICNYVSGSGSGSGGGSTPKSGYYIRVTINSFYASDCYEPYFFEWHGEFALSCTDTNQHVDLGNMSCKNPDWTNANSSARFSFDESFSGYRVQFKMWEIDTTFFTGANDYIGSFYITLYSGDYYNEVILNTYYDTAINYNIEHIYY